MYTEFFGLNEKPFSISPDPRYLYMSRRHADALAHLIYGVSESGGFIQLTGEVGTGKTTLIRSLLEQLPDGAEIALILNPQLSAREFLQSICSELRIGFDGGASVKELIDALNAFLLGAYADDRRIVLIVDEAQTLSVELLEQVRLLTNLETAERKLLQIILIGQPELRDLLAQRDMRQVAQRITGRFHLEPLSQRETALYVHHRMRVAGTQGEIFTPGAVRRLYRSSGGIPRLINVIADRALLAGYTRERRRIDAALVNRAAAEVFGRRLDRPWWPWVAAAGTVLIFAGSMNNFWSAPAGDASDTASVSSAPLAAADAGSVRTVALPDVGPQPAPAGDGDRDRDSDRVDLAVLEGSRPSLPARLNDATLPTDTNSAVTTLFELWDAAFDADVGAPCEQARRIGLECLSSATGSLAELRRLDRPAILTLVGDGGERHQLVLRGLGRGVAELAAGSKQFEVDIADLTHYWFGEYLLLWRPELASATSLTPGIRSDDVLWLRRSVAEIRGAALPAVDATLYDDALEAWVRSYQRQRQLTVDGIVGTKTQIALSSDLGQPGVPMLMKAR